MTHASTAPGTGTEDQDDDPTPGGASRSVVPTTARATLVTSTDVDRRPFARRRRRATLPRSVVAWHERGRYVRAELAEAGMATAEYAIATLAAVGFAGLLVVILKGNEVKGLLTGIVRQALSL